MNTGDPDYYKKDLTAVRQLLWLTSKQYIINISKGKNFVETSFVPKGQVNLIVEGSKDAGIVEEDVTKAAEVKTDSCRRRRDCKNPDKT